MFFLHKGGDGSDCLLKAVVLDLLNAVILQYSSLCCGDRNQKIIM